MRRFQQTKHALGSMAYLTVVVQDDRQPNELFARLWEMVDNFERRFSRFLPDSELTTFNQSAGKKHAVTLEFRTLLAAAKNMSRRTDGLYNPFVLPALQRAGYKGSWPYPERAGAAVNYELRQSASWQNITLGRNWAAIPKNTAVDFGGIGKGYLLDKLAAALHAGGVTGYWLSLGGDISCAGFDEPGTPWLIGIQDAMQEGKRIASVSNEGRALAVATSGVTKRKGMSANGVWHHLIDPRSGLPAETDILTATVCSDSATEADVYAKCLVIAGADARDFMKTAKVREALLQRQSKDEGAPTIEKVGTIWLV